MQKDNSIFAEVPRRIVNRKQSELKISDSGAAFAWVDLSAAVGKENYGLWFPDWLISEGLECCRLTIQKIYISKSTGKEIQNRFTVERKDKIKGKRFQRFTYGPEELLHLLSFYADKVSKAKEAQKHQALAKVTELIRPGQAVTFWAVGYINGKMFFSEDVERFRRFSALGDRQGGKQISAKSFELICDGLSDADVKRVRELIEVQTVARDELRRLSDSCKLPYPFTRTIQDGVHETGSDRTPPELTEIYSPGISRSHKSDTHLTVKGYPEQLLGILESVERARSLLKAAEQKTEEELQQFRPAGQTDGTKPE